MLGSPEGSTEGTADSNLEGLLLGDWLVSLYGLDIVTNVGNEIGLSYGKVIDKTLGALDGISLGTYYGTVLRYL